MSLGVKILFATWILGPIIALGGIVWVCELLEKRAQQRDRNRIWIFALLEQAWYLESYTPPHERGRR